ncbi:phospho-N-acetylmuramoyl-pentapeptide-transferase, partial [bacterium]|nr:phospho-N-acetylmuramoyl-pentapeptide-transferase [bacterium]
MLYKLLYAYADSFSALNVFKYITVRSFISFFMAFVLCVVLGPWFIRLIKSKQFEQSIRDDGPESHKKKSGTPTMGGGLMLLSILLPVLMWVDLANKLVLGSIIILVTFALVGAWDDALKILKKNSKGLSGRFRLVIEFAVTTSVIWYLTHSGHIDTNIYVPFLKNVVIDFGWVYVPFAAFIIVGCANAINLTDGLDGLAIVPIVICVLTFALFSYLGGHFELAEYLKIPFIKGAGELVPLSAAVVAAGLGFLWFNAYPAQIFMGDIGSLSLGSFVGVLAVLSKNELL